MVLGVFISSHLKLNKGFSDEQSLCTAVHQSLCGICGVNGSIFIQTCRWKLRRHHIILTLFLNEVTRSSMWYVPDSKCLQFVRSCCCVTIVNPIRERLCGLRSPVNQNKFEAEIRKKKKQNFAFRWPRRFRSLTSIESNACHLKKKIKFSVKA